MAELYLVDAWNGEHWDGSLQDFLFSLSSVLLIQLNCFDYTDFMMENDWDRTFLRAQVEKWCCHFICIIAAISQTKCKKDNHLIAKLNGNDALPNIYDIE